MKNLPSSQTFLKPLFFLLASCAMVAIAFLVRLPISPYLDFRVLYFANKGILEGIPLYDAREQAEMMSRLLNIDSAHVNIIPFPYLPWLALGTLYLGFFPIEAAMTLWVELNFVMAFASLRLLTDEWDWRSRLLAFPLAILFIPVMGTLAVGQYDFPILLGVSMLAYGLRKENVFLSAAGAWLTVIKPHLGALIFLSVLIYLLLKKNEFSRKTVRAMLLSGLVLFLMGFIADPLWLVNYPKSLVSYGGQNHIVSCSDCASLPVTLLHSLPGISSLARAAWISIPILTILFAAFFFIRKEIASRPHFLLSAALLATLLSSPYLYNYDFILLLLPFSILIKTENRVEQFLIAVCYFAPAIAIAAYGRAGNISLLLATITLCIIFYVRAKRMGIDRYGV